MAEDKFTRKPVTCQKCGSPWMEERHVREMWHSTQPTQPPLYGPATKMRVICGDCGFQVWPEKVVEKKPEKGKKE